MGKTKRILSFLIALIMVLALVPFNAIVYAVDVETGDEAQTQNGESGSETPKKPVASNIDTEAELADAVKAGGEVVLGANIVVNTMIEVLKDVTVVLDLNGYTITSGLQADTSKHIYPFNVYGNLTVKDSVGTGSISGRGIYVQNGSKFTLESGTVYGIDANGGSALFQYGGDIVINGGVVEQTAEYTYNYAINAGGGTVTVNGGKIIGKHGAIAIVNAVVDINGGELICAGNSGWTDNVVYIENGSVTVDGGSLLHNGKEVGADSGAALVASGNSATVVVNGGTFIGMNGSVSGNANTVINGGTFGTTLGYDGWDNLKKYISVGSTVVIEGQGYYKNEDGSFTEVEVKPELPTATVAPIQNNSNVLFGLTFSADSVTAEQLEAYGDYFADFVITFNKDLTLGYGEGTDGWLSGNYGDYGWVNVPAIEKKISVEANKSYRVMDIAAELLDKDSLHITYDFVVELVKEFQCGVYLTPKFVAENPDFGVEIGLSMFEPVEDENGNTVLGKEIKVECTDANGAPMQTTFTSKDISLELPSAKVYPVVNPDLSFGLTFEVNKITDAQLDYYGDWYADFTIEFSVPGSDLTEIVLGTGEGADGWLSGQYDEWSENWVNVPFKNEVIPLNKPIKVMDFAAKIMGKDGLKITYREVYEGVEKFNCGVYLTPEFIEANGEFTVSVDLAMFEAVVDENGNVTEVKHDVVYTDKGGNVIDKADVTVFDKDDVYVAAVAEVNGVKYATLGEAMAALKDGDTLTLLADIDGAFVQFIEFNGKKNITITAAEGVVINGSIQVGYHVSHIDNGVDRSESTFTVDGLTVTGTLTVNSNDKNVVVKNCDAAQITVKTYTMNGMNITIDGNTVDGTMGTAANNYGMVLVPNATDYNLVVNNNTFKNVNSHAFVIQGMGDGQAVTAANSIAVTSNTFESWGLGGSSNRAAFKIWGDTKYAPASSDLNGTTNAMRELVDKIAASGNTYLSTADNTVEYDAYGAAGDAEDFPDPVYVTYVAQVGEQKFESVIGAINYAVENGITEVKLLESVRELMPTDVEIVIKNNLTITADAPVEVKFYNNGTNYDFVIDCEGYGDYDFTIGENVTFVLEDRIIWVGYYASNIDVVVNGTLSGKQIWAGGDIYVNETGTLNSTGEAFVIRRGKTVFVDGGEVNANYFNILAGNIYAENGAVIESGALWIDNKGGYAGEGAVSITLWDSTLTVKGNLKSASDKFVNIDVYNSTVEITDVHGYGASVLDANTTLYVDGESGKLTIYKGLNNNGVVDVFDGGELIIANNATVTNNGSIYIDSISTISGPANMGVETEVANMEVEYVDGKYILVEKISYVASVNGVGYATLQAAIDAAQNGETVVLLENITLTEGVTVTGTVVLDLNGKTITGTDNSTGSFALFTNKGNLTITGEGKITLVATNNRGWNAYSSVISNTVGGKLTVENGTIEHLGGTDMAYGIDNLTNGKGTYAETIINGGTIKSTYRAIRQFLNGVEAQNILTVNGGTIEGANKAIWMQDPSKNANTGKLTVGENAVINGNIYLTVTAGSTEWPVEVSIAAAAVNGEVLTSNVPAKYTLELNNGVYGIGERTAVAQVGETVYYTLQDAINAGGTVVLLTDIELDTPVTVTGTVVLELNGKTISQTKAQTGNYSMITNDGILTIQDTVGGGKISYTDTVGGNFVSNTIMNRGTLTLLSGRVENMSSAAVANAGFPYAIDTSIWGAAGEVVINIKGGTVYCESYSALRLRADSETEAVNVTISGGEIYGRIEVQNPQSKTASAGKLTITDGIINKNNSSMAIMIFGGGAAATNMKMEITGGEFVGAIGYSTYFPITGFDEKAISGGTFDTDVSAFCADGYVCVANDDGTYGIEEKPVYTIKVNGVTVTFQDLNSINYWYAKSQFKAGVKYYAVVREAHDGCCDNESVAQIIDMSEWVSSGSYYKITIRNISAKEISTNVEIQIFADDVAASEVTSYSIEQYAIDALNGKNTDKTEEFKKLCYELLQYGAKAQLKFNHYNVDENGNPILATKNVLPAWDAKYGADEAPSYTMDETKAQVTQPTETKYFVQANGTFGETIMYNIYIEHYASIKDFKLTIALGNKTDTLTYVDGKYVSENGYLKAELYSNGRYLKVTANCFAAKEISETITFELFDGETVLGTVAHSMEQYCANQMLVNSGKEVEANFYAQAIEYGRAAQAYAEAKNN